MTKAEKRKQGRFSIHTQPEGKIFLRTANERFPVRAVKDISNAGVSVFLDKGIPVRSQVAVEYSDQKIKLEVHGLVSWCTPKMGEEDSQARSNGHVVGVELLSPLLFFSLVHHD
jgi:hypothetical protein